MGKSPGIIGGGAVGSGGIVPVGCGSVGGISVWRGSVVAGSAVLDPTSVVVVGLGDSAVFAGVGETNSEVLVTVGTPTIVGVGLVMVLHANVMDSRTKSAVI